MIQKRRITTLAILLALLTAGAVESSVRPIDGVVHERLRSEMAKSGRAQYPVWIFFEDRADRGTTTIEPVTDRAQARRARAGFRETAGDRALDPVQLRAVENLVTELRTRSKWLNGVSAVATREEIEAVAALPFVIRIQEIARAPKREESITSPAPPHAPGGPNKTSDLDYGLAEPQLEQINVPGLHAKCLTGRGVHVLMTDSGFYPDARAFANMDIAEMRDFVDGDDDVSGLGEGHGTSTLSVIGANDPGFLIGPAYEATYYLARTEDVAGEYIQEEDFWAAALAWGESLGVDVVSSSVGYIDWYTYEDMDGQTALITLAAEAAIARGVTVVNSAGNEGALPWRYMIAPADGEHVLSIGGVTINGNRSSFSSFGPTFDGRIKPDVAALASSVALVGNPRSSGGGYGASSGTSFSCPLVAGVVAQLIQHDPAATPGEISDALRSTGSQAANPDSSLGYGIVDAVGAAEALAPFSDHCPPAIAHDPPEEVPLASWPPTIEADVTDDFAVDSVFVTWTETNGQDGGHFPLALAPAKNGTYTGTFPGEGTEGNSFAYSITAIDEAGNRETSPSVSGSYELVAGGIGYAFYLTRDGEGSTNPFELGLSGAVYQVFFDLPKSEPVSLVAYDIAGRVVREIVNETRGPGAGIDAVWDLRNKGGEDVGPGVYFLRFEAGSFETTQKIVLLR